MKADEPANHEIHCAFDGVTGARRIVPDLLQCFELCFRAFDEVLELVAHEVRRRMVWKGWCRSITSLCVLAMIVEE